jgi:hypothetical protein
MGALQDLLRRALLDPARIARMPIIGLLAALVAGQRHLLGVDHDHVVAAVDVRRIHGLVLAAQPGRDQRGEPAEHEPVGIDQAPAAADVLGRGGEGLHRIGAQAFRSGLTVFRSAKRSITRARDDAGAGA